MKQFFVITAICSCITILAFNIHPAPTEPFLAGATISYVKKNAALFAASTSQLLNKVKKIRKDQPQTLAGAKEALKECRLQYKKIEFFMTYFFRSATLVYNEPNKYEVEEPFMEYRDPAGLQVIEMMLFSKDVFLQKENLSAQVSLINTSASDINALLYNLNINDQQILESIRLALIRVIALGISGFDAPELKTGIGESRQVMATIKETLSPLLADKSKEADSVLLYLNIALKGLGKGESFDSFNRLDFLTDAALPLQYRLGELIRAKGLEINTSGALNYKAKNLFRADAINLPARTKASTELVSLGQELFFEKGLSGNSTRSCATCHQPDKYFTDQVPKSIALDGVSTVERNAPTLFYSAYQYSQFWDGRVKSLDQQINTVLLSTKEMAGDHTIIITRLRKANQYVASFKRTFSANGDSAITIHHIALAITAFLETLSPFNSSFDRYINGDKNTLTKQQVNGFNLFMGKAQCGTCHFAPIFNGLTPPFYNRTELEVLGVTKDTNFKRPALDPDSGRYSTFPIRFYQAAFKTPTVRNVAKTAPYMHNGAFETLNEVLKFYNQGGGAGLGVKVPTQTLSPKPLHLDSSEINDLISFLNALTDSYTLPSTN